MGFFPTTEIMQWTGSGGVTIYNGEIWKHYIYQELWNGSESRIYLIYWLPRWVNRLVPWQKAFSPPESLKSKVYAVVTFAQIYFLWHTFVLSSSCSLLFNSVSISIHWSKPWFSLIRTQTPVFSSDLVLVPCPYFLLHLLFCSCLCSFRGGGGSHKSKRRHKHLCQLLCFNYNECTKLLYPGTVPHPRTVNSACIITFTLGGEEMSRCSWAIRKHHRLKLKPHQLTACRSISKQFIWNEEDKFICLHLLNFFYSADEWWRFCPHVRDMKHRESETREEVMKD